MIRKKVVALAAVIALLADIAPVARVIISLYNQT